MYRNAQSSERVEGDANHAYIRHTAHERYRGDKGLFHGSNRARGVHADGGLGLHTHDIQLDRRPHHLPLTFSFRSFL